MLPIRGISEVALKVKDLSVAERFYCEVLGLEVGLREERRKWLFLRAGRAGILLLQEDRGEWPKQHFAFAVEQSRIESAAALLRERGITVAGPVFHEWMPGNSLYFVDPDGHDLELCAAM
jgi:catechol 2,3-dioxygenase-like lactoylglutathione lyase family enzyme